MLPVANLHLKDLYDTTVEFFALRSPVFSLRPSSTPVSELSNSRTLTPVPDPIARLTKECSSLRERLDAAESRQHGTCSCHSSATPGLSPLSMLRRDFDATKNELARSQIEAAKLEERCKMLEKMLRETKDILRARDAEIEKLKRERDRTTLDRRRSDESQRSHVQGRDKDLSPKLPHVYPNGYRNGHRRDNSNNSSTSIVSITTSEEERAQARSLELFLTRTDTWSGAQVLQAVHDLNSEILQFAASVTEMCTYDRDSRSAHTKASQAMHDTVSRLGPHLAHILSTRDHSQDPILVQLALQGAVSSCISKSLSTFCLGWPSKSDAVLMQVYAYMYAAEPQPTSSRWRSLTHRHIHKLYPTLEEYGINDLSDTIFRWCTDILSTAGYSISEIPSSKDSLRSRFGEQVRRIARSVSKLAQITREEIMSTNFDIVAVNYSEQFDPQQMTDAFGEYGVSRGTILSTTELGLRCTTHKNANELTKDEVGLDRRLLLPPKVVLESVLDVLEPK